MRRVFRFCLFLYPREYRDRFAEEMMGVFEQARNDRREGSRGWYVRFLVGEVGGLIGGAATAWLDRPAAQTVPATSAAVNLPLDLLEAQQRIDRAIAGMVAAIAHHQFERARLLSDEERVARANLRTLRARYGYSD